MPAEFQIKDGLKTWPRPPAGYAEIGSDVKVEAGDVQKLAPNKFSEYPAEGLLVGKFRGAGGTWYRKQPVEAEIKGTPVLPPDYDERIERAARAMAKTHGWTRWDTATKGSHTLTGYEPEEEREKYREMARTAFAIFSS